MMKSDFVESIGESVVLISDDKKLIYANRMARKVLGIEFDAIEKNEECCYVLNMDICFGGACPADRISDVEDVVNNEPVKRHGHDDTYRVSTSIMKNDEGKREGIIHTIKVMEPVHELLEKEKGARDKLHRESMKMQMIFDSIGDGVFTVDGEGNIDQFSRGMEEVTGFKRNEILGKRYPEVLRGDMSEGECPITSAVTKRRSVERCREIMVARDGKPVPVILNAYLLPEEGDFFGLVCTVWQVNELDVAGVDLYHIEKKRILDALVKNNWRVIKAAESIGYSRVTMWRRMKKFGIQLPNRG